MAVVLAVLDDVPELNLVSHLTAGEKVVMLGVLLACSDRPRGVFVREGTDGAK